MTTPYNDSDLTYDWTEHRYIPTLEFIKTKTGLDLLNGNILNAVDDSNPSTLGQRTLDDLSAHLYAVIYSMTANTNLVEYLLAKDEECRIRLKRAFVNEIKWALRNGDFWFSLQESERQNTISRDTISLFERPLPNGIKIFYQGIYSVPCMNWREDY